MRKFLIRWWYTPNWRADTYHRMMLDWNGNWLPVGHALHDPMNLRPEFCGDWQHSDGTPEEEFQAAVASAMTEFTVYDDNVMHDSEGLKLRRGQEWVAVNPFTPEEEWITIEEFRARQTAWGERLIEEAERDAPTLRITKIDVESGTVTLDSTPEPERECVDPGWQATVYNLELLK